MCLCFTGWHKHFSAAGSKAASHEPDKKRFSLYKYTARRKIGNSRGADFGFFCQILLEKTVLCHFLMAEYRETGEK